MWTIETQRIHPSGEFFPWSEDDVPGETKFVDLDRALTALESYRGKMHFYRFRIVREFDPIETWD